MKAYWPRPEQCLSFSPRDPERIDYSLAGQPVASPRVRLYGQHVVTTNRYVGRDFLVFQVVFQLGALHRLTGLPADELTNSLVDAESVFSSEIGRVSERLRNTEQPLAMVAVVEQFLAGLIRRAAPARPLDRVAALLLHQPAVSIDWLAGQACLSPRQLQRQFAARQGIGPKLFARVARFDHAMRLRNARPKTDWLTLALHTGYHDYQHLGKDCQEFTRQTPTGFWLCERQAPERTFGHSET